MRPTTQARRMWKRRLLAAAATIMLALGTALPTVAMADAVDDLVAKAPDHAMTPTDTLVDNGDGTYDVTLSVTGVTEETEIAKPIDIIYVVDRSLSMAPDLAVARRAITAAANKYLTAENAALPDNQQVRMAVITYGRKAQVKQGFTNSASDVTNALPKTAPETGTNWEAALVAANGLSGRTGVEKRIVLLSDSEPTLRTSAEGYTGPAHFDGTYGMSVDDPKGRNYSAALRAAQGRGSAILTAVSLEQSQRNREQVRRRGGR
ncbi:MAG: VWA domain-containing protein [Coriobacteriaceae bacterium]|nr:VWA domain-containing protein [Coriobacteriaceae bacterium]